MCSSIRRAKEDSEKQFRFRDVLWNAISVRITFICCLMASTYVLPVWLNKIPSVLLYFYFFFQTKKRYVDPFPQFLSHSVRTYFSQITKWGVSTNNVEQDNKKWIKSNSHFAHMNSLVLHPFSLSSF